MKGDARVIEYLNRGLRHELTAINQYWLHYRLLANWGYNELAKKWRKESIEEMQHADRLVDRIIFLDGFPNMQVLDPLHIGQNVKEVLDCDLAAEISARALYEEAAAHCHSARDFVTRDLFEALMQAGKTTSTSLKPNSSSFPSSASSSIHSITSGNPKTPTEGVVHVLRLTR
jgi:bacterioferritin